MRLQLSPHRAFVVFGLPIVFFFAMTVAPKLDFYWVWGTLSVQLIYLFIRPNIERSVWVLLSYLFTIGGGTGWSYVGGPVWVSWFTYVIIPIVFVYMLLMRSCRWPRQVVAWMLGIVLVSFLSALWNGMGLIDIVAWNAHFLRFPILFLALTGVVIPLAIYRQWLVAYVYLVCLQIPATIIQNIFITQEPDAIVGTMFGGLTGNMGLAVVVGFCSVLGSFLCEKKSIWKLLLLFAMAIPLLLGGSGFPLMSGPVLAFYIIGRWGVLYTIQDLRIKKRLMRVIVGAGVALVCVGTTVSYYALRLDELNDLITGKILDSKTYTSLLDVDLDYLPYNSRQLFIATTIAWFRQHPEDLVLGTLGPRIGLGRQSSILAGKDHTTNMGNIDSSGSPMAIINEAVGVPVMMTQFTVQLPRTLLEVGFAGLFAFWALFWQTRAKPQAWMVAKQDAWLLGQMWAFRGIWFLYVVLGVFYIDIWRLDHLNFGFWLWAGLVYQAQKEQHVAAPITSDVHK